MKRKGKLASYAAASDELLSSLHAPAEGGNRISFYNSRGFYPHAGQMPIVEALDSHIREIFAKSGKRSGKSRFVREEALYRTVKLAQKTWVAGPTWDVVDRIFDPLWAEVMELGLRIVRQDRERRLLRFANGGLLEGVSWIRPDQIEGEGVQCLITDESQYLTNKVSDLFRARLVGDYVWFRIGSCGEAGMTLFETEAELARANASETWAYFSWPTWMNPDPDVQQAVQSRRDEIVELEKNLGPDHQAVKSRKRWFRTVYGAESLQPTDSALPMFDGEVHLLDLAYDPTLPVTLWVDPGFFPSAYVVLAVQEHPKGSAMGLKGNPKIPEIWVIDEIYVHHHLTEAVIDLAKERPWWDTVQNTIIDVSANKINDQTGISTAEYWRRRTGKPVASQYVAVSDGLESHRRFLTDQRLFHDKANTPNLQSEYKMYRMQAHQDLPIDRFNHALKAIAYGLYTTFGSYGEEPTVLKVPDYLPEPVERYRW